LRRKPSSPAGKARYLLKNHIRDGAGKTDAQTDRRVFDHIWRFFTPNRPPAFQSFAARYIQDRAKKVLTMSVAVIALIVVIGAVVFYLIDRGV
jgi:hypothetical protein